QIYAGAGFAVLYYKVTDPMPGVTTDGRFGELVLNVNAGVKYPLSSKFMANLELGHHTVSTDKMDGFIGPNGGIFGGVLDSYTTLNVGITYYFIRGKETNYCALPAGAAQINIPEVDYDRIQKMIDAAKTKPGPAPEIDYKKIEDIINKKLGDKAPEKENRPDPEDKLYLVGINFDSGSAEIKSEYTTILSQNAGLLLKHSKVNVLITGYTDDQGTPESNLTLSNKRAENVKNYLIGKGVSASRITTDGKGAANPVGDNKTESGKAMNRRVEFTIK
ncbi:MAG: OmpA family protein, partial [Ignavibacteriaceae bacterium]|nr:OmpA family protein [Ignavibacteriaceae bacterium]